MVPEENIEFTGELFAQNIIFRAHVLKSILLIVDKALDFPKLRIFAKNRRPVKSFPFVCVHIEIISIIAWVSTGYECGGLRERRRSIANKFICPLYFSEN